MSSLRKPTAVALLLLLTSCDSLIDPDGKGVSTQTIVTGGLIRYYDWVAPEGDGAKPVLLVFHGLGGNATEIRSGTEFASAGTDAGYVVAFPQAANEANRGWSVGCEGCTTGDNLGINDVAYVDAVLDDLAMRTSIDRTRVYAAGFSMGGWFTYTLACERATMLRAIAPVGGLMPRPVAAHCTPAKPVGALVIFGDQDPTQPYAGRPDPFGLLGADSSATFWSTAAHCRSSTPDATQNFGSTQVVVAKQDQCNGDVHVERHRVVGLNHTWPSGRYSATREILRFFAAH